MPAAERRLCSEEATQTEGAPACAREARALDLRPRVGPSPAASAGNPIDRLDDYGRDGPRVAVVLNERGSFAPALRSGLTAERSASTLGRGGRHDDDEDTLITTRTCGAGRCGHDGCAPGGSPGRSHSLSDRIWTGSDRRRPACQRVSDLLIHGEGMWGRYGKKVPSTNQPLSIDRLALSARESPPTRTLPQETR